MIMTTWQGVVTVLMAVLGTIITRFQRIHHQQSGHSIRKHVAKIVDDVRRFL